MVKRCPDGGKCHHECDSEPCWRTKNAAPLRPYESWDEVELLLLVRAGYSEEAAQKAKRMSMSTQKPTRLLEK